MESGDARTGGRHPQSGWGRMIVEMRTMTQAAKLAAATGGRQLPGDPDRSGTSRLSRRVDVGADFEVHRAATEAVSVLFTLFDDTTGQLVEVPSG
jgi:putative transposase